MGIVPAAGLAQGIDPPGVAEVSVGTVPARGTVRAGAVLWVLGTDRAGVPAGTELPVGTGPARGIVRPGAVLSAPGTGPVAGIGRLGAGPSCGCS